jgi:hypothetical protein
MSHSVKLDQERGVIVLRYSGIVSVEEIQNVLDELVALPGFRNGLRLVADFRKSTTPLTGADVRELARYAERSDAAWGTTKWALIASNDTTFGLARMYMALTDGYRVTTHVFRDPGKAERWLGLETQESIMNVTSQHGGNSAALQAAMSSGKPIPNF